MSTRPTKPARVLALRTCVIPTCRIRISVEGHGALCAIRRGEWRSTGLCKFCAAYYWVCCECDGIFPRSTLTSTDDESGVHYRCAGCFKSGKADCNQLPRNQSTSAPRDTRSQHDGDDHGH